jgi:hypothetical protein
MLSIPSTEYKRVIQIYNIQPYVSSLLLLFHWEYRETRHREHRAAVG